MATDPDTLNEDQVRRLRITCEHIDRLLSDIEGILNESASLAAFPSYTADIAPVQQKTIEDYIARIRARLIQVLDGQGIPRKPPWVSASRAINVRLCSIDIAAEELKPKHMRGFGNISDTTATELNGIAGELQALVARLEKYLAVGTGQDFRERLQRLEEEGNNLDLLSRIERVIAERGLVEFRGTIASILDRAEDRSFEIAVFGRVSSGKSSLLNAVLGTDVLPVGVTPVTSVPTRITHSEQPSLTVSFADAPAKLLEIARLGEFATEQQNPGNKKHVTRITVTLPAPRLSQGVTFVDTPGLGSLATSGAAETLAYLPRCDLGVVLIDAGSTLTSGDLQTILTLQEAAIPAHVLLSKADLLNRQDCEKTIAYVREHIISEIGVDLPVHPVSVRPSHRTLLDRWFEEDILPLYSRSQELRASSLQRKIGALRESVVFILHNTIQRSQHSSSGDNEENRVVEARLRRATGLIDETRVTCEREIKKITSNASDIFSTAAVRVIESSTRNTNPQDTPDDIIRTAVLQGVHGWAKNVQGPVESLALRLQDELEKSAGDLGIADIPCGDEFLSLVRGMPVFDLGAIHITIPKSAFSGFLGKQYTENHMAEHIRRQLGEPFSQALASYLRLLQEWSKGITNQLGQRFEIYAERYRAQADQSSGRQDVSMDEIRAIEEDLKLLGVTVPDESATESL